MSLYTSLKVGGPCDVFIIPKSERGVKSVGNFVNQNKIPLFVIGNGTDILIPDHGLQGAVMKIGEPYLCDVHFQDKILRAWAGISLSTLLTLATNLELTGLEFAAGIPGTLGGAIVMNASANGKSIGEIVDKVKFMNRMGETHWVKQYEAGFEYRGSRFKNSDKIILEAELKLKNGVKSKIRNEIAQILKERTSRFPLKFPSAGCIFKNPSNTSAGKLISLAGCKGLKVGNAQVSTMHANFIVNLGGASYKDIKTLISTIKHKVYEKFGVKLEPEIIIL